MASSGVGLFLPGIATVDQNLKPRAAFAGSLGTETVQRREGCSLVTLGRYLRAVRRAVTADLDAIGGGALPIR
jgi:hypothetical protein